MKEEIHYQMLIKQLRDSNVSGLNQGDSLYCYLFTAMRAMASLHPKQILNLFVVFENKSQIYDVRLFKDGMWYTKLMDCQTKTNL
jgi:hypothetical protein